MSHDEAGQDHGQSHGDSHDESHGDSHGEAHSSSAAASNATSMQQSEDMLCYWTGSKCAVSKLYVASEAKLPMAWAMCIGLGDPDAGHAMGWDCSACRLLTQQHHIVSFKDSSSTNQPDKCICTLMCRIQRHTHQHQRNCMWIVVGVCFQILVTVPMI